MSDTSYNFSVAACIIAVLCCVTFISVKGCEQAHEAEMKCVELGMIKLPGGGPCVGTKHE